MNFQRDNFCFVCGKENPIGLKVNIFLKNGNCNFTINFKKEYQSWTNIVHGGLLSSILDEAMWWACASKGYNTVTAELKVRFKKPLPVNKEVKAEGRVVEVKKKLIKTVAEVKDKNNVYAIAQGKFFVI